MVGIYTIISLTLIGMPYIINSQTPIFSNTESPPCIIPPCVDVCQPLREWQVATNAKPYCLGHPLTRCQLNRLCNQGCFAQYFDDITGLEIIDCELIYPVIPPPVNPPPLNPPPPPDTIAPPQPPVPPTPSISSTTAAPQPLTTLSTAAAPQCPLPGESCTNTGAACCTSGGILGTTRCEGGTCCVRNERAGCLINSDCCSSRRVCINGRCQRDNSNLFRGMAVNPLFDTGKTQKGKGLGKYVSIKGTMEVMLWISFMVIIGTCCSIIYWCGKTVEFQETYIDPVISTDCSELSDV